MNIEAFIFDFDGVLADSVEIKTEAFAKLFESFGDDIINKVVKHHRNNGGMTRTNKIVHYFDKFINRAINKNILEDYCNRFSSLVVERVVNAPEINGVTDFLKTNYRKTFCFIDSATPDKELQTIVERRNLCQFFKEILGSNNSKKQNLQYIIDKYQLNPSKCIFFGDAESDYDAAIECYVPFIGILPHNNSPLLKKRPNIKWYNNFFEINF